MYYTTIYEFETENDDLFEIEVELESYEIDNDSFDHLFGFEKLPDYISAATWFISDLSKLDEVLLEQYSVEEITKKINDDEEWFCKIHCDLVGALEDYKDDMKYDL